MVRSLIIGNFLELCISLKNLPAGFSPCVATAMALAPGWPGARLIQLEVLDTQEIPEVNQSWKLIVF